MPFSISISNSIGSRSLSSGVSPTPRESFYIVQQNAVFPHRFALNQNRAEFLKQQHG